METTPLNLSVFLSIGIKCLFFRSCFVRLTFKFRYCFWFGDFQTAMEGVRCSTVSESWRSERVHDNSGSLWRSLEFYALHLYLQHQRPGIWHTTPTPPGAGTPHAEQWNFTLRHFRWLCSCFRLGINREQTRKQQKSCLRDLWWTMFYHLCIYFVGRLFHFPPLV